MGAEKKKIKPRAGARSVAQRLVRFGLMGAAPVCLILLAHNTSDLAYAEARSAGPVVIRGASEIGLVTPYVYDGDLRDLPRAKAWKRGDPVREVPRRVYPRGKALSPGGVRSQPAQPSRDPLLDLQERAPQDLADRAFTTPNLNFQGTGFTGVRPPDTVGDVGPNHYIQMGNHSSGSVFTVYDKAGTLLAGPTVLDSLIPGGNCSVGAGDPIVLYDRLADRWLMSEFADDLIVGNHLCIYISQTADPVAGGWLRYD